MERSRYLGSLKDITKKFQVYDRKKKINLGDWNPDDTSGFKGSKKEGLKNVQKLRRELEDLQKVLYAEQKHKVLIILQAMDTAGKDSTINLLFEGVSPAGVRVADFKTPSEEEKAHDFLWRIHKEVPRNGEIVIFNRSHYESVLIERVHSLVPKKVWLERYSEINDFERMLHNEGTLILKFYLHISKKEQKVRLEERQHERKKEWKFSPNDLPERKLWKEYMRAYEDAIGQTSTPWAPWYIVPSNHKWFRDLIVGNVTVGQLKNLKMKYPKLDEAEAKESII
jgi:PPK2 family polyphosphate:nucleotide phosphotransferase